MFPTYIELEGFKETARLGNISRAAQSLGISQPSLSQSLKKLEERVGSKLFVRSKSGSALTDAGRAVLAEADQLLNLWKRAVSRASLHTEEFTGKIRVGCHVSVAQYALSPFVRCVHEEFPKVHVELIHDLSRRLVDQVLHNELDMAIAINPFESPELVLRQLTTDEFTLFVNRKLNNSEEINNLPLFIDPKLHQTQTILRSLYAKGYRFEKIIESSSLDVCAGLLRDNVGLSVLPERVQKLYASKAERVEGAPTFHDEIKLVYRVDRISTTAAKTFVRRIEKVLKDELS